MLLSSLTSHNHMFMRVEKETICAGVHCTIYRYRFSFNFSTIHIISLLSQFSCASAVYQPSSLLLSACVMCWFDVFVAVSFRLYSQCTVCCYTFPLFFSLGCCCHSCCLYCWQTCLVLLLLPLTVQFHAFAHRYHIHTSLYVV